MDLIVAYPQELTFDSEPQIRQINESSNMFYNIRALLIEHTNKDDFYTEILKSIIK